MYFMKTFSYIPRSKHKINTKLKKKRGEIRPIQQLTTRAKMVELTRLANQAKMFHLSIMMCVGVQMCSVTRGWGAFSDI